MIRQLMRLIIGVFIFAGMRAASAAGTTYQITGVVLSSVDDSPLLHARLSAVPVNSGESADRQSYRRQDSGTRLEADADEHGHFLLSVPSAGRWRLMASAVGYVTQAYNAHDQFSSAVVLTQSNPHFDLRFRLAPEAEISGTVLDEAGEAVRNARVVLEHRPAPSPDREQVDFRNRMVVQTDDRGVYDFSNLAAGDYRVKVDAKPWYSTVMQPRLNNSQLVQDSSLDVTYPLTWYPGVNNPAEAEVISLKPADLRRSDFQLTPIPAVHVTFASPATGGADTRFPSFPVIERVDAGGGGMASIIPNRSGDGQMDVGGLAPGVYRVRMAGPNQERQTKLIEVRPGDGRVIDALSTTGDVANITIEEEGPANSKAANVELREIDTGVTFNSLSQEMFFRARNDRASPGQEQKPVNMQVPPGKYEVRVADRQSYLTGISAKGAGVSGRYVTVRGGEVILKLSMASGRASVHGIASENGKPVEGAMVLLVPAGLDDPGSFAAMVRDQTNTDGSFDLNDVIPGQYILVAVANGWHIQWKNAETLQHYLIEGVPLELHSDDRMNQNLGAQQP